MTLRLKTSLRVVCPRCLRGGVVFYGTDPKTCAVVWDGLPDKADVVTLSDLLDPYFGCGRDRDGDGRALDRLGEPTGLGRRV